MKNGLAVLRKAYSWFFLTGVVLVFLATALFLYLDHAAGQRNDPTRLRVVRAVASLENCLTCHGAVNNRPVVAESSSFSVAYHLEIYLPDVTTAEAEPADSLKTQLDTRLVTVGYQILDAPSIDSTATGALTHEFLRVYQQSQSATDSDTLLGALGRLEALEQLLHQLGHQLRSGWWTKADQPPSSIEQLLAHAAPPPSFSLIAGQPVRLDLAVTVSPHCDELTAVMPAEVVLACHRRGPPAGARVESVFTWFGEKIAV
jgi:hypothetical protein